MVVNLSILIDTLMVDRTQCSSSALAPVEENSPGRLWLVCFTAIVSSKLESISAYTPQESRKTDMRRHLSSRTIRQKIALTCLSKCAIVCGGGVSVPNSNFGSGKDLRI